MIISGPKLPVENLYGSTMVPSPTGKGIVVIGGMTNTLGYEGLREDDPPYNNLDTTNVLLELSGDSIDSLQWTTMAHKLKYPRAYSVAFPIPDGVVDELETTKINSGTPGVTDCHILTQTD